MRLPGLLGIPTTMLWLRMSTAPHKNELIHTRRWSDVVDVEIATFEWGKWWNESPLHQSLGYRTPAEVEAEFLGTSPQSRNNGDQGKCLGSKPRALQ